MDLDSRVAAPVRPAGQGRAARPRTAGAAVARIWTDARPVERVAYVVAGVLVTSGLVHLVVLLVTGGTWTGPVSLRKPMTFGLSFGLTLATVATVTSPLTLATRARTALLGVFTAVSVVETALITLQAWRGVPSHLDFETPFDTGVSTALAAGGGVIIVTVLAFAAAAVRGAATLTPSMRLAVRSGFALLVAGLAVGAVMIATGVGEARTGDPQLAYATLGTLTPVHAAALHAILVLPALAWLLGALDWSERRRVRAMRAAVAGYVLLTAVTALTVMLSAT